jgi:hypothetical protein
MGVYPPRRWRGPEIPGYSDVPVPDYPNPRRDDPTICDYCLDRPKRRLWRFQHRLWMCSGCRVAWFTECDHTSEKSVYYWRVWARSWRGQQ